MAMIQPLSAAKTYDWVLTSDGKVNCFSSSKSKQTIQKLWEVRELSKFHDEELAKCTTDVNAILDGVVQANKDPNRQLGFIVIGNSLLLVWSEYGAIGSDDDPDTIVQALGLKRWKTTSASR